MAIAKLAGTDTNSIRSRARQALEETDGQVDPAVTLLIKWAHEDMELRNQILESSLERLCRQAISEVQSGQRTNFWNGTARPPKESGETSYDKADILATATPLFYPLPNGKPLGMATLVDLDHAEKYYAMYSTAYEHRRQLMAEIKKKVKKGQFVKDVYDDVAILKLRDKILAAAS